MVYTPRSELTPEQRQAANSRQRDKYNERKVKELREQLELKDKEVAALRSAIKESKPGAGSRKTPEGGIKKTGQQASRRGHGGDKRRDNENEAGQGDGRGGRGGRAGRGSRGDRGGRGRGGSSSNNNNNDNGNICFRCRVGNTELELMGQGAAARQFPFWCPLCGYIRNDRIGSQRLEVVMENNEMVLRPVRPSLTAPGQTLAMSPYAASSAATPIQPPPPATPASGDPLAFAERMFDRALSSMSADRQQYLNTINMMADRFSLPAQQLPPPQQALPPPPQQTLPPPPQQTLPPPLQQALPPPAPQQAFPVPPQPLAIEPSPAQDSAPSGGFVFCIAPGKPFRNRPGSCEDGPA